MHNDMLLYWDLERQARLLFAVIVLYLFLIACSLIAAIWNIEDIGVVKFCLSIVGFFSILLFYIVWRYRQLKFAMSMLAQSLND